MKSRPITLWLIRAGQTIWAADGRLRGSADLPMSEAGLAAVTADVAQWSATKPSIIHHPPDEAAIETARLYAARTKAKAKPSAELADPNLGVLEGLTLTEFEERFPSRFRQWEDDPLSLAPPEGEDIIVAARRVFSEIARILRRTRSDETAVVLHDIAIGFLMCWLSNRPFAEFRAALDQGSRTQRHVLTPEMIVAMEQALTEQRAVK